LICYSSHRNSRSKKGKVHIYFEDTRKLTYVISVDIG